MWLVSGMTTHSTTGRLVRHATTIFILAIEWRQTQSQTTCTESGSCFGTSCDFWVIENDASCLELETDYACECTGCECGVTDCPATCFNADCDSWTLQGVACSHLEQNFDCNCAGCNCDTPIVLVQSTERVLPTLPIIQTTTSKTTTTTTPELIVTVEDDGVNYINYTGTFPLEIEHSTTSAAPCPPGHLCESGPPVTTTVIVAENSRCITSAANDGFCNDENNSDECDWDGGDCCGASIVKSECLECNCLDPDLAPYYNCDGTCASPAWQGDGFCDDENNACQCNWDGGDCCGSTNENIYCTECECKDVAYDGLICHAACEAQAWAGDSFCDDGNNHCGCDWDGGDCCGAGKHDTYCTACECLDPDNQVDADHVNCIQGCYTLDYYGDGFCDDSNNVCGCDWDGGDCCGSSISFLYCSECNCRDPNYVCPGSGSCEEESWINDYFCDDGNNNCGCNWDHGDCCGNDNYYIYCTECECLDDAYISLECSGQCEVSLYQGDGFCDDSNNNCGCDWDNGDCCGITSSSQLTHCDECLCLDPDHIQEECAAPCQTDGWKGDGFCDDENNVCGCDWDGGDCCFDDVTSFLYCDECNCLDPERSGT